MFTSPAKSQKDEELKMEQSEDSQLEGNVPLPKNEENFSLEEWTIIEEDDNAKKFHKLRAKISSPESESSENENTSDAEEAHEVSFCLFIFQKRKETAQL